MSAADRAGRCRPAPRSARPSNVGPRERRAIADDDARAHLGDPQWMLRCLALRDELPWCIAARRRRVGDRLRRRCAPRRGRRRVGRSGSARLRVRLLLFTTRGARRSARENRRDGDVPHATIRITSGIRPRAVHFQRGSRGSLRRRRGRARFRARARVQRRRRSARRQERSMHARLRLQVGSRVLGRGLRRHERTARARRRRRIDRRVHQWRRLTRSRSCLVSR